MFRALFHFHVSQRISREGKLRANDKNEVTPLKVSAKVDSDLNFIHLEPWSSLRPTQLLDL
jgi:hypothetical protein